jgi:hypothetical protein
LATLLVMGKKARIKRLRLGADRVDAIGEAYIHALGQLMAGEHHVSLFGYPVATGDDASLALQRELAQKGSNPEDVLSAVKRKHRADVEM